MLRSSQVIRFARRRSWSACRAVPFTVSIFVWLTAQVVATGCASRSSSILPAPASRQAESAAVGRLAMLRSVDPAAVLALGTAAGWSAESNAPTAPSAVVDRAEVDAEILSLRVELPPVAEVGSLAEEVHRLLDAATTALNAGDFESAARLSEEAARRSNGRSEALEVWLLAELARGSMAAVPAILAEIGRNDPSNPIAIASVGLEAARGGRVDDALRSLAWFVGPETLPRRGRAIPLPSAPGELAEQLALAALAAGRPGLAARAAEEGLAEPRLLPVLRWRLEFALVDALAAAGRKVDAAHRLASFDVEELARALGPAGVMLASLRRERLDDSASGTEALARWSEALRPGGVGSSDPIADLAFLRAFGGLRELATPGQEGVVAELRTLAERRARECPARAAVLALAIDPRHGAILPEPPFSAALVADGMGLVGCMRILHLEGDARPVALAVALAAAFPLEIDRIVHALLLSGAEIDGLLRAIERDHAGGVGDALRSRILALAGEPERAFAIAETACSRDRASRPALVAAVLAAAAMRDESLIDRLELEVLAGGGRLSRCVAAAWLAVGRPDRAAEAARRAVEADPRDGRAAILRDIALLGDRDRRSAAIERLGTIVDSGEAFASDARQALAQAGATMAGSRAAVDTLGDALRILDESRSPLAVECHALACLLDGAGGAEPALAARWSALPTGTDSHRSRSRLLARFLTELVEESPAVPSRRIACAITASRGDATGTLPDAPLAARIDARAGAEGRVLAQARLIACALRPRTPAASAAIAEAALDSGDIELAAQSLARAASGLDGPVPPQAARALLRASRRLCELAPGQPSARTRDFLRFAERVEPAGVSDLGSALAFSIAAGLPVDDIVSLAMRLAPGLVEGGASDAAEVSRILEELVAWDGDPYLAGRVAAVIAAESRLPMAMRTLLARSGVALQAASGVSPESIVGVLRDFHQRGVIVFDPTEGEGSLAETLRRAGGVYQMLGDERGAERMLVESVSEDPGNARSLNDLAYLRAGRGQLDSETISMAERSAAALPDDPSVLDTLGYIRYLDRRLRDGIDGVGAVTLLRQALRLRPEEPSIATLDHLGDALWRDGDQSGAVRCWQEVGRVARLRHPPDATRAAIAAFQRREYGVVVADPAEVVRRQFGDTVERADRKLREVAEGRSPTVAELPDGGDR